MLSVTGPLSGTLAAMLGRYRVPAHFINISFEALDARQPSSSMGIAIWYFPRPRQTAAAAGQRRGSSSSAGLALVCRVVLQLGRQEIEKASFGKYFGALGIFGLLFANELKLDGFEADSDSAGGGLD
jgi:hypothetical protein